MEAQPPSSPARRPDTPTAAGDAFLAALAQLAQVFQNLVANAVKLRRPDAVPSPEPRRLGRE